MSPGTDGPEGGARGGGARGAHQVALGPKLQRSELERGIPRIHPPGAGELDDQAPPRQRYPIALRRAVRDLIRGRELLLTFVERDLRVRYKQVVLGGLWAILQPLVMVVIFTLLFGRIARIRVGAPYPIFAYSALSAWGFFAGCVGYATNGVITNGGIVRKVSFPREMLPLAAVLSAAFDFAVSLPILVVMLFAYGERPALTWLAYPLMIAILAVLAIAVSFVVAAITVFYRDTRYGVPTALQLVLFASPVAYPLERAVAALPHGLAGLYRYANPLAPIMDGIHRALLFDRWPDLGATCVAAGVAATALAAAYAWYKRIDPTFADVI